ncbi:hypothetical protein EJ08DRAFT_703059 [Tothia fuscella]|uniref:F-box domain-containing protein n=1 Tax=Tothia fuscella TaxID=1048955 RepID=A0A9P4TSX5_9PEZI|nr:hypothetical protein EJ08DRAFT_703059 [Tothia fuscella]
MASFEELPFDITDNVVGFVAVGHVRFLETRKDLACLSRVSKNFYDITIPYLYQRYDDYFMGWYGKETGRRFLPFLKTLCHRPDLARHVKQVNIGYWSLKFNRVTHLRGPLQMEWADYVLCTEKAVEMGIVSEDALKENRKKVRCEDDLIALYEKSPFANLDHARIARLPDLSPMTDSEDDWLRQLG